MRRHCTAGGREAILELPAVLPLEQRHFVLQALSCAGMQPGWRLHLPRLLKCLPGHEASLPIVRIGPQFAAGSVAPGGL